MAHRIQAWIAHSPEIGGTFCEVDDEEAGQGTGIRKAVEANPEK